MELKNLRDAWRCRRKNISLQKRLKGEDYGTDISNGRFKSASTKYS